MSAIVPVVGWSNSQPQITAPLAGSTAAATSEATSGKNQPLPAAACVVTSSNCTATKVVRLAGRIPLKRAMRKNSSRPRCTITPTATVNHQPPSITTRKPNPPAAQPLAKRAKEVAERGRGINVRQRSRRGALRRPVWPGCRGAASCAPWPAPLARHGLQADPRYRWHPPAPPGWWC